VAWWECPLCFPGWPTIYTLILSNDNASVWRSAFAKPDCGGIVSAT
jgi:hypothetical protein